MDTDKLKTNLGALPKMLSAWWMTFAGLVAGYWLQLPPEAQTALLAKLPWLPVWAYPTAAVIIGLALRAWPQGNLTVVEAEAKSTQTADPGTTPKDTP